MMEFREWQTAMDFANARARVLKKRYKVYWWTYIASPPVWIVAEA